jgi:hypothetical protein
MQREPDDLSAMEQIRHSQEWVGGTGHLLNLWSAAVRSSLIPEMDQRIKARLGESQASRYEREPSRSVLQHKLRQYQLAGHDLNQLIDRITAAPLTGAVAPRVHGCPARTRVGERCPRRQPAGLRCRYGGPPAARIVVTRSRSGPVRSCSPTSTARSPAWMT